MPDKTETQTKARFRLGATILVIGFLSPLLIPLVTATDLSTKWKATISGALALGIPELFSIIAIAIMGKQGFLLLKEKIAKIFKKYGPPETVSRNRYRLGLAMFIFSLLMALILPYLTNLLPFYKQNLVAFSIAGDVLFISSIFVLGGEFWDKLQALFIYDAKVEIPAHRGS
ncbi:MAG: transporter suffix domain-containing protein [Desulfobulbales bacterium]